MIYHKPKQYIDFKIKYWTCFILTLFCNLLWSASSEPNPDKINLALRRTADHLLRIAGDNGVVLFNPKNINVPIPASEVVLDPMLHEDIPAVDYIF